MTPIVYDDLMISTIEAENIALKYFGMSGNAVSLAGELDFNFCFTTENGTSYMLKVSRPDVDAEYIDFQQKILEHLAIHAADNSSPAIINNKAGASLTTYIDGNGHPRMVRMLSWIEGRLWSSIQPISDELLYSLGKKTGKLTSALANFYHPYGERTLVWDIDQSLWIQHYVHLFTGRQKNILERYITDFLIIKTPLDQFRKSIIHNDVNDNNILVSNDIKNPIVTTIIDFGDAIYTSTVNDVAIAVAYGIMDKPDPLAAAAKIIAGYHTQFPLKEAEISNLYILIAMRLCISVTKSAINKSLEPNNTYLLVSEKPAWKLLDGWMEIDTQYATYTFRNACGLEAHPLQLTFESWAKNQGFSTVDLFPELEMEKICHADMSVGSTWLGHKEDYENNDIFSFKLKQWSKKNDGAIIANGYLETRPFYSTDAYRKEGNQGPQYRSVHLGLDLWVDAGIRLHAPFNGEVFSIFDNDQDKDYGPTIIIKHSFGQHNFFYTLYGHLSKSTLGILKKGQSIVKGQHIGYVGNDTENGHWTPHVHFQIMLDLLGNVHNFPGVAFPKETDIWKSICPDPNLFLHSDVVLRSTTIETHSLITYRSLHLGKGLSLSYPTPLFMVRGDGVFLIDKTGRKYLDTVNNVAHVGHEHTRVVNAGQAQMALLNTNTRYLHESINQFADRLLSTLPLALSVVHFVNSGSEANELALRMAYTYTRQKNILAMEVGYHGNTNAAIEVSSYKFNGKGGQGKANTTHLIPLPDTFRGLYRGPDTRQHYASHVDKIIKEISDKGQKIAGFIHESIISCGGQIELPEGFLTHAYAAVRNAGGLCIADEVQTGCGRMGSHWWAFQLHNVVPDIVTIGKPLGNGHPVAAVVCTRAVADAFANGMEFFNTFGGNPVSCSIGMEVVNVIKDEDLMLNALNIGQYVKNGLLELQKQYPIIGDVRGKGLFLGFELTDADLNPLADQTNYLANRMCDFGVLMSTDGPDHNVLKIKPPMVFNESNADELIDRLQMVLKEDMMHI